MGASHGREIIGKFGESLELHHGFLMVSGGSWTGSEIIIPYLGINRGGLDLFLVVDVHIFYYHICTFLRVVMLLVQPARLDPYITYIYI